MALPLSRNLSLPDADVRIHDGFWDPDGAADLLARLRAEIPWRQDTITLFGKTSAVPRLHCWFADAGMGYRWSGLAMRPSPWTPALLEVRERVCAAVGLDLPTCLANLYRDGKDTVGWHADDEPELGPEPVIASASFGATRDFVLRHRDPAVARVSVALESGSLLVMSGTTQQFWKHALPRRKRVSESRVNLTFRTSFSG